MGDELRQRTEQLLADYLGYCARVPGTAGRRPSTPEAALLRCLALRLRLRYHLSRSRYRGYQGNRLQVVANVAQKMVRQSGFPSWGKVVALVTFAGILLERPPARHAWELKEWEADVGPDCRRLVAFLCDWLTVEHRAWLEAHSGWVSRERGARPRAGRSAGTSPHGWHRRLLSLLRIQNDLSLEFTAGPGSSLMLYINNIKLYVDKIIVSSQIFNPHLPA
ncbi:BCL2 like 10 [Phyllostomus discolor]|uniref:Bcl-2-like protein 10 n=1 Tax=Phyllostomus discolor TaxID=89673 RepID=A0A834BJ45_9CHIR|nr:BCL2 like 10 [Phyllostomus discolor]